jgi:hypothetical protein
MHVCKIVLATRGQLSKNFTKTAKIDLQTLESASNLLPDQVLYHL